MSDLILRTILPEERDAVLDLLAEWYNDRDFFARYLLHDPTFSPDLCFVAEQQGKFLSTFQVFRKQVLVDGTVLDVAGVGNVFTTAPARGRGIASQLLRYGLARLPQHGFDVSLLFAVRLGFYGRLGYQSHLRYLVFWEPGARIRAAERYEIRSFEEADLPAVRKIYDAYSARLRGATLRSPAYWEGQLRYAGNPHERFLLAEDRGRIVAYTRATELWNFWVVMEHGYAPGCVEALVQLLLRQYAEGTQSRPGLLTQLVHEPEVIEALRARGLVDRQIEDFFWMWRVVSADGLALKLGVPPSALEKGNLWRELLPPESSVYWISDRF